MATNTLMAEVADDLDTLDGMEAAVDRAEDDCRKYGTKMARARYVRLAAAYEAALLDHYMRVLA